MGSGWGAVQNPTLLMHPCMPCCVCSSSSCLLNSLSPEDRRKVDFPASLAWAEIVSNIKGTRQAVEGGGRWGALGSCRWAARRGAA